MKNKLLLTLSLLLLSRMVYGANFPDISVHDLKSNFLKKVTIIDVNGPRSFANGHIPGAIEFSTQSKDLKNLLPKRKDTLVVAYCGGPSCRAYLKGANAAAKLGYTNVRHLSAEFQLKKSRKEGR